MSQHETSDNYQTIKLKIFQQTTFIFQCPKIFLYFSQSKPFIQLFKIKRDSSGNSKGFGFVRFKDYNNQCVVLGKKHFIDGRLCDVKIPNSQVKNLKKTLLKPNY